MPRNLKTLENHLRHTEYLCQLPDERLRKITSESREDLELTAMVMHSNLVELRHDEEFLT